MYRHDFGIICSQNLCRNYLVVLPGLLYFMTYTSAHHQGMIKAFRLHFWGVAMTSVFFFNAMMKTSESFPVYSSINVIPCYIFVWIQKCSKFQFKLNYCSVQQKMLQSPYFFFDVVYLHNGVEEVGDETSWRVSEWPEEGATTALEV